MKMLVVFRYIAFILVCILFFVGISRALHNIAPDQQFDAVRQFKQNFSRYQRVRDLIVVGAYQAGSDPQMERAVQLYPHLEKYLQQKISESADYESSLEQLYALFQMPSPAAQGAPQPALAPTP